MSKNVHACWSSIGVHGDRSCARLVEHVHCRNCPVYADAAHALLDVPIAEDYIAEWTERFAPEADSEQRNDASAFVFRIGAEWLALPTHVLDTVVDVRPVHSLPHRTDGIVLGLVNVNGVLIVCASSQRLFGAAAAPKETNARIRFARLFVIQQEGRRFALTVDEVHGIERYASSVLEPIPATTAQAMATYAQAILPWRGRSIGLIDHARLFAGLERAIA